KIENDIYANLGVSPALIYGGGGNYASANANSEKFFSFIITILEQFEGIINRYLNNVLKLPKGLSCEIKFDRSTILDKNSETEKLKELYMQTGIAMPYLESVMGVDYQSMIAQARYEKEILKTEDYLFP